MADRIAMFVTGGHTVLADDGPHGPGDLVTLDATEAARLAELGFLSETSAAPLAAGVAPNPTGIGPQGGGTIQGPRYERPVGRDGFARLS